MSLLREWLFVRRHKRACAKLQRIVEANRKSPACVSYREKRAAMLKHTRKAVAQ